MFDDEIIKEYCFEKYCVDRVRTVVSLADIYNPIIERACTLQSIFFEGKVAVSYMRAKDIMNKR